MGIHHNIQCLACIIMWQYSRNITACAVFHIDGGVPWDFPSLPQISPLKLLISTVYFVLVSHPIWHQVLHLLIKSVILYETLTCSSYITDVTLHQVLKLSFWFFQFQPSRVIHDLQHNYTRKAD